jgi:transcriptional regulator with XRE-family HTH domain
MPNAMRRIRRERDLTQSTVAEILGVTQSSVHKWEHGAVHPRPASVRRLVAFFGLPADVLLASETKNGAGPKSDAVT